MQTKPRTLKPRAAKVPATSYRDVFDLDFPHERDRMSRMDKYTLRAWIIGTLALEGSGWTYRTIDRLGIEGSLRNGSVEVRIGIRSDGVRLVCGEHVKTLKTDL